MRFSVLLFMLANILKAASWTSRSYKRHIRGVSARVLIKTEDGERARLFIFDRGRVSSKSGDHQSYDVALVFKDAATGFSVMTSRKKDASFNAAASGRLKVLGMSLYAQWFEAGANLVMGQ